MGESAALFGKKNRKSRNAKNHGRGAEQMSLSVSKVRVPSQLDNQGRLCMEAAPFEVGLEGKVRFRFVVMGDASSSRDGPSQAGRWAKKAEVEITQ